MAEKAKGSTEKLSVFDHVTYPPVTLLGPWPVVMR